MGRGEGKAGGSIWKVEGGLRGGDRPGAALYHIMSLYCFFFSFVVSYRIALSMSPGIVVSSSVCHPHIDIHNHPHPHRHTLTLSITSAHTRYIYLFGFRFRYLTSQSTYGYSIFDLRFFFRLYIGPLGFRTIPHFECACSVHVPPTWLGVCVSATTLRLRMLIFLARPLSFFRRRLHLPFLQLLVFSFRFFSFSSSMLCNLDLSP